jgi:hypothetical protein
MRMTAPEVLSVNSLGSKEGGSEDMLSRISWEDCEGDGFWQENAISEARQQARKVLCILSSILDFS